MNDLIEYEEKPIEGQLLSEEDEEKIQSERDNEEVFSYLNDQSRALSGSRLDIELANARRQSQAYDDKSDENMAIRQAEGFARATGGLGSGLGQSTCQAGQFQREEIEKFKERSRKKRESEAALRHINIGIIMAFIYTGIGILYYINNL